MALDVEGWPKDIDGGSRILVVLDAARRVLFVGDDVDLVTAFVDRRVGR